MSAEPFLTIRGARRAFGARTALAGVDLTLVPGSLYALLGRNGAGKTTLIRAVSGRVRLDVGEVRLRGADPRRDPAARRRLGLVPQEIALYPDLTARENLEVLGRLSGLEPKRAREASDEALRWIGLDDRAGSRVSTLSGGMKRRVNLAAGVLHRPDVLLLDEPTVGVDPQARERIHELLRDLRASGMAILLSTHDLDQAAVLADRIGILDEGQLKAEGALPDLVARHFDATRQLTLRFGALPGAGARSFLESIGVAPLAEDARRWSGHVASDVAHLASLEGHLVAAGAQPTEISVREPDLWGVFFKVTGKELHE